MSEANLWLDTACEFNPAPGDPDVLTRAGWVEGTIDQWAKFAAPVAESMNDALASVISERLGGAFGDGEIAGMFAGPVPIPIPDGMKDPAQLMKLLGNTSFAMQLGHAAGNLSHEVHGSFDQGIALLKNPAGGLIAQNATEYAKMLNGEASAAEADTAGTSTDSVNPFSTSTDASANPIGFTSAGNSDTPATDGTAQVSGSDASADAADAAAFEAALSGFETTEKIPESEVLSFLALQEMAHARLYASVPWLMPRFEALIGKYARGISIDLDAMEEQLRDATSMDPESISGAVNLTKVGIPDTPEQREALASLESLLAMVEGWVDCVVWRAGMAHLPHIEQLREMMRRERAMGGPAERTFESLLGLQLRPKRMREATGLWEMITAAVTPSGRIPICCLRCLATSPQMARLRHPTPLQVLLPMPTVPLLTLPQMARPAISIGMPNCPSCSAKMAKTVKTATRRIRRHSQPAFSQFPLLNDVQEHSVCITDARHKNRDGRLRCTP